MKKYLIRNWFGRSFQAAPMKNLLSRFAQLNKKIIVPEKVPDKKEKLLPPAFISAIRFIGHRKNMLRLGFRSPSKIRLLYKLPDLEALAILEAVRRAAELRAHNTAYTP